MTVDELIEKITALQHKEAVYTEAAAYLEEFLPSDVVDDEEPEAISAPGCVVPEVSFEVIEEVIEELSLVRDGLVQEIESLKTMEITDNDGGNNDQDDGTGSGSNERNKKSGKKRKRA